MAFIRKSLVSDSKTGFLTCKAGGTVTAGYLQQIMAGGTITKNAITGMYDIVYLVQNAPDNAKTGIIGIAQNSGSTTGSPEGTNSEINVQPIIPKCDIINIPFMWCGLWYINR
jgi:hypothetical protein